jgi:hypothetical protein
LIDHQQLKDSVEETKKEIGELLSFSKNEIEGFSSYSLNEIKKVTHSIDTISESFNMLYQSKYYSIYYITIFIN